MKLPKTSSIGRQEKALAFVLKCGFSGEKITVIFYFCIEKKGTRNRKKKSQERVQGPYLKQIDLKAGRVMVRVWGEDGSWGWNKGSFAAPGSPQAPHGPPSTSLGRGLGRRHPKNTGLMKVGSGLLGLGNKNTQSRLNPAFVIPLFLTCYLHFHHV